MSRRTLPAVLVAFCAVAGAHADDKLLLKSVNIELPNWDRMFEGPRFGCGKQQLPGLPLRRHGAQSACAVQGAMVDQGRKNAHGLQGADRSEGRRRHR